MIVASTLAALPLLVIALIARRFRSDLEELAWRLMAMAMLVTPFASLLPKTAVGFRLPLVNDETLFSSRQPQLPTDDGLPPLVVVYAIVASVLLARLGMAVITAWKLRRNAEPFGAAFVSPALRVPVTAGVVAPAILLPPEARTWSPAKLGAILAHERAHVARRDPLWRLVGRAATAISWFNPLAWLAAAAIERIAEERADREAIAETGDRHEYANVILDLLRAMTRNPRRILATSMFDGRGLGARIDAILQPPRTRRSPLGARVLLATLVAGTIFTTGMTTNATPQRVTHVKGQYVEEQSKAPTAAQLEFFRKRDELRTLFRETVRGTSRRLGRSLGRLFMPN